MRTVNSIKNSSTAIIGNVISIIVGFIAQAVFIKILGAEYLGLNGLFTNILSMLSIFELGVGSAIVFNLYRPIAENDERKIVALMNFYKKTYRIITLVIFIIGIIVIPFIDAIVGEITINVNVKIIYLLFLISTSTSYLMTYKRNLIIANQKNYIINIIHIGYVISLNIIQLLVLYLTKHYYIYLIIKIIFQIFENLIINIYANKMYKFLRKYPNEKIEKDIEKDIFKRVKALFFHKIGGILVLGTDNIIISKFFGILSVGLYANYNIIVSAVTSLFSQIITNTTASVGNLLISGDKKKNYDVFSKMRFLNAWISIMTATTIFVVVQPFISIWIGVEYKLELLVVGTIVFNYFQNMQRIIYLTFKDSAGIWVEDKFVPLIEAVLNIVSSIICLKIFGLAGVFMGSIISGLILWCYSFPKFVYKKIFDRSYKDYIKETITYIIIFIIIAMITYEISLLININNDFIQIIINMGICIIIPNLCLFIIYRKTDEFKYFLDLINKIIRKTNYMNVNIKTKKS